MDNKKYIKNKEITDYEKITKVLFCLCLLHCLLGQSIANAWASIDEMLETERFSISLTCENNTVELSDIKINVYSAELAYFETESGYAEYAETLAFSVLTDETGSVSFYRPSDAFSITICVETLPDNCGMVEQHTRFFTEDEISYHGTVAEIYDVSVERENEQLLPVLKDQNGNVLLAEAEIVQSGEDEAAERTSLNINETDYTISYDETVHVKVQDKLYTIVDRITFKYDTSLQKERYLQSKGFITENHEKLDVGFLTSEQTVGVTANSEQEDVFSESGRFHVLYDTYTSKEEAERVAAEFDAVDSLFCTTWGFLRPYTSSETAPYTVFISHTAEERSVTYPSGIKSYIVLKGEVAEALNYNTQYVGYPNAYKGYIAHEYMHAIMYRYGIDGLDYDYMWMHECFANWAGIVYEGDYAAVCSDAVNLFLNSTGYSLDFYTNNGSYDDRNQGSCVFAMYIFQQMGGYTTIRKIMESYSTALNPLDAIDAGLKLRGYSLKEAYVGCATFNYDASYFYDESPTTAMYKWELENFNTNIPLPYTTPYTCGVTTLCSNYYTFVPIANTYANVTATIDFSLLNDPENALIRTVRITSGNTHSVYNYSASNGRRTFVQYIGIGSASKLAIIPINASRTRAFNYTMSVSVRYEYADGAIYSLKNVGTGKYMNVHNGVDQNNTNVYQWTKDGSIEQNFKFEDVDSGGCLIRAMCSSNGTNRVLDIVKSSGQILAGCNVQIYSPVDPNAQEWQVYYVSNGRYRIVPRNNTGVSLTVYGTSNGSSSGTTSTSAGNIYLSAYTGASNQLWELVPVT